jgi:hypothetical protein
MMFSMKTGLAALLLALLSVPAAAREPAFEREGRAREKSESSRDGDCQSGGVVPYRGPLFDAMTELDESEDWEQWLADSHQHGVHHVATFAFTHGGRFGQDPRRDVAAFGARHRDGVTLGAPKVPEQYRDLFPDYVSSTIAGTASGQYAFVGEILMRHGDKVIDPPTREGERYIDPFAGGMERLLSGLAARPVPVMTHWEVYRWDHDWPVFNRLYHQFPGQTFIWPHMGFGSPEQVSEMLTRNPNLVATLSSKEHPAIKSYWDKEMGAATDPGVVDACVRLLPAWRSVLVQFRDRILFGTDAHTKRRLEEYPAIIARWRHILGQLPADVVTDIAFRNAERIYGAQMQVRSP